MRRDKFLIGSYYHIVERGCRSMNIFNSKDDWWDCLKLLFYLNNELNVDKWDRYLVEKDYKLFDWPKNWPPADPLIELAAFCLHTNHFHLLVREIKEKGISNFMHRLPNSMTLRHNKKYDGSGTIFQGPYKLRLIEGDADLENVALYIMVKNVFERFPGGLKAAENDFEKAWRWALDDPFSSFADYAGKRNSPLTTKGILEEFFGSSTELKKAAHDYIKYRNERELTIKDLLLE